MRRAIQRIPLRVAVTGTRGKSTVTRMIAAALKEAGFTVLAKTTGSRTVLILPDGREEEIERRGWPTITEQKRLLKRAAGLGVQALVTEMMSIQPECLAVESRRLLEPLCLVITNTRLDHREEMGRTKSEIAQSLSSAIRPGAAVFVLDSERRPEFDAAAAQAGAKIILVKSGQTGTFIEGDIRLAVAVAGHLGVAEDTALRGIRGAPADFGSLKAWKAELGTPPQTWTLVSAFAANEPESSRLILEHLRSKLGSSSGPFVGILNFRADRGDRTRQWLDAYRQGFFSEFRSIYVVGSHVRSLKNRGTAGQRPALTPLTERRPLEIMERIVSAERTPSVVIGLGNIGGAGAVLIEHWQRIGSLHAL